jgi:hypothetical protein
MPPRRTLSAVQPVQHPKAPDLRDSVKASIDAMDWLTPTDQALADAALKLAEQIEQAQARADLAEQVYADARGDQSVYKKLAKLEAMCDVAKTVGWLGPQLQGMLRDLGGTPATRKAFRPDRPVGGRLADLRASAAARKNPGEDLDSPED